MKAYQNPNTQVVIIASSMITLQSISNNGGIKGIIDDPTTATPPAV